MSMTPVLLVHEVDAVPRLAAVDRLVEAAVGVRPVQPAEDADVSDVRVLRVDRDRADLVRILEADVLPRLAAVDGLVHAVAEGDAVARVGLAGADVEDVLVRRGHGHGPDGDGRLAVELVLVGDAVVGRLEQPAGGGGDPVGGGVGRADGEGRDATAHGGRADAAPRHLVEPRLRDHVGIDDARRRQSFDRLELGQAGVEVGDLPLEVGDLLVGVGVAAGGGDGQQDRDERDGDEGADHDGARRKDDGAAPGRAARRGAQLPSIPDLIARRGRWGRERKNGKAGQPRSRWPVGAIRPIGAAHFVKRDGATADGPCPSAVAFHWVSRSGGCV